MQRFRGFCPLRRKWLRRCARRLFAGGAELGENLFDRVQVGAVFWQEEELGAGRADLPLGLPILSMMTMSPLCSVGTRTLLTPKALAIDRPLDQPRRYDPVVAQGSRGNGVAVGISLAHQLCALPILLFINSARALPRLASRRDLELMRCKEISARDLEEAQKKPPPCAA